MYVATFETQNRGQPLANQLVSSFQAGEVASFNRLPSLKAVANPRRLEPTVCRAHNAVSNRPAFGRRLRPVEAPAPSSSTLAVQRA